MPIQRVAGGGISTPRWDDLRIEPTARSTGAKTPSFSAYKTTLFIYDFDNAAALSEKEIFYQVQMPHAWKEGTTIYPHVHWIPRTAGTAGQKVRWGMEYTLAKPGATFGATVTQYGTSAGPGDITVQDNHIITSLGSIDMSGQTLSTVLICRIFRNSSHVDDSFSGVCGLLYVDIHLLVDSFGSREEYNK
jgi:hypothetical protein